jgi:integrase
VRADGWDASTAHNLLDPLRVICRRARERGELGVDPLEGLELEKPTGRRMRIAQPAEATALLDALDEQDRALWATYLYAGLRRGEARATRCHDLDLKAGIVRVERTWDDVDGELSDAKTDAAERVVPMLGPLAGELRAHLMRTGRRGTDLVFGESGTVPFEPSTIRRRAIERWEQAGLKPIQPHECRHTFVSTLLAAGVDLKRVSTFAGHSSVAITADRYGHLLDSGHDETVRQVAAFLAAQQATETGLRGVE